MEAAIRDLSIFNELNAHEYELVASFAASLVRNRKPEHTEAYYKFKEMRERMKGKCKMAGKREHLFGDEHGFAYFCKQIAKCNENRKHTTH